MNLKIANSMLEILSKVYLFMNLILHLLEICPINIGIIGVQKYSMMKKKKFTILFLANKIHW